MLIRKSLFPGEHQSQIVTQVYPGIDRAEYPRYG